MLEELAKSLISDIFMPDSAFSWETELVELSKSYLTLLQKYDGLLQTLLSMKSNSPADVFIGRCNLLVVPLKLDNRQQRAFLNLLVDYLHGFSIALACNNTGSLNIAHVNEPLEFLFQQVKVNRPIQN